MEERLTVLTIKAVAERTGVSIHTLRAWERRYGVPQPNRVPGNQYRLYDEDDLAEVIWMKRQIESGVSPARASVLLQQQRRPKVVALAASAQPLEVTQSALQTALLKTDERGARHILDEAFAMFTPEQVALQIIQPTMREIGERWMRGETSVWQEHVASNLVRQKLLAALQSQAAPALSAPHLVAACAPAEEHELGLLILMLIVNRRGWRTTYLGQGTPLEDIAAVARANTPNALAISVTTVVGLTSLIPVLQDANRPTAPLTFGGRLLNALPTLRDHLPGAYLGEDAGAAVHALATLTPRSTFWSPSKRAWAAVMALQTRRMKIASDVVALMPARASDAERSVHAQQISYATLYLIDTLLCAVVFDVPELMDLEREWLKGAMPARAVSSQALTRHRETLTRVLRHTLTTDDARRFEVLLEQMEEN